MAHLEQQKNQLRQAGYKLTRARLTVLEAIDALGGHVTSSEVLEEVARRDESIGRASVFRTLDLLTSLGIVRPTYIETSQTPTYVMMPEGHHHHIICTTCNRVIEFDDCGLSQLEKTLEDRLNVSIEGHLLEFYGICEACQSATDSEPSAGAST
jgi:Fur family ferric uptake transcriptional regulator